MTTKSTYHSETRDVMSKIISSNVHQCNTFFLRATNGSEIALYGRPSKSYISNLISCANQIEMHKSVFGLFHVIAEACLYYSKEICHKRQTTLGMENKHKRLGERQTRTHERTLIGLGLYVRDDPRFNKRLPYERRITDLGIILYLIKVKHITDPNQMAEIIGRYRKLPVEKDQNCRSHIRSNIKDKEIRDFSKIIKKQESEMSKPTKPIFANVTSSQDMREKAAEWARATLKARGVHFPSFDAGTSPIEFHELLQAYSQQESALIVEYMRMPSGPRPLELDNVLPRPKGWDAYHDK